MKIKEGDIIIAKEDMEIPSMGYSHCIYKDKYYRLEEYLPMDYIWHIEPIMNRKERRKIEHDNFRNLKKYKYSKNPYSHYERYDAYLSEKEILEKFDCSFERREKLKKLNAISNKLNNLYEISNR